MTNITWKIPHITPSDSTKIKMYDIIKSGTNLPIGIMMAQIMFGMLN